MTRIQYREHPVVGLVVADRLSLFRGRLIHPRPLHHPVEGALANGGVAKGLPRAGLVAVNKQKVVAIGIGSAAAAAATATATAAAEAAAAEAEAEAAAEAAETAEATAAGATAVGATAAGAEASLMFGTENIEVAAASAVAPAVAKT